MDRRRIIASVTALTVGIAVMLCACAVSHAKTVVTADDHACCKKSGDAPVAPTGESEFCHHCGNLTIVPAKAPDRTGDLDLAPIAAVHNAPAIIAEPASPLLKTSISLFVPPTDLLRRACALRL